MKKFSLFSCCLAIASISYAQNVGINDPAPSARLTIKGTETTLDGQAAAIKLQNTAASTTNVWYIRAGATGNNTPNGGFSIADNIGYHFNINQGGNIGLGIAPSAAKLDVNGGIKIEGTNYLEFGAGIAGKEMNAGKIGYNSFVNNALSIVGAGTTALNRKLYFFAEGGSEFNGAVNIGGSLQLNGNAGLAGQVLTSNSTAAPTWQTLNAALANDIRFEADFTGTSTSSATPALAYTTAYNLNPAVVSISGTGIFVSRSGLYHIEGFYEIRTVFNVAPSLMHYSYSLNVDGRLYRHFTSGPLDRDLSNTSIFIYKKLIPFVNEVYILAPGLILPSTEVNFNAGPATLTSVTHSGKISGYLMAD
jgi:hypothetical protein